MGHSRKNEIEKQLLMKQADAISQTGAFSLVLECVETQLAQEITESIPIPTIGIGSGKQTNGQVLVYHDLLGLSPGKAPKFVTPIAHLFSEQKKLIENYLKNNS